MYTRLMVVVAMVVVAGAAEGREREGSFGRSVTVCMGTPVAAANPARAVTSEIFARIGVRVDWRRADNCPADGIAIQFRMATDYALLPGALAYALPFEGVHICIFWDRVHSFGTAMEVGMLSHVLAHEIGHILEGFPRHAEEGVMKAEWNKEPYAGSFSLDSN